MKNPTKILKFGSDFGTMKPSSDFGGLALGDWNCKVMRHKNQPNVGKHAIHEYMDAHGIGSCTHISMTSRDQRRVEHH